MNCDICDKNITKQYYICLCIDCIKPGTVEHVIKKQIDRNRELSRYISEQREEILDLTKRNNELSQGKK